MYSRSKHIASYSEAESRERKAPAHGASRCRERPWFGRSKHQDVGERRVFGTIKARLAISKSPWCYSPLRLLYRGITIPSAPGAKGAGACFRGEGGGVSLHGWPLAQSGRRPQLSSTPDNTTAHLSVGVVAGTSSPHWILGCISPPVTSVTSKTAQRRTVQGRIACPPDL